MAGPSESKLTAIRVSYAMLCEAHATIAGKHTYYGVFDRVFASAFPARHSQMVLAIELLGPPEDERELTIRYTSSEDDDIAAPMKAKVTFSAYGTAQIHVRFEGLPIPKQGIFSFKVLDGDRFIGERIMYAQEGDKPK